MNYRALLPYLPGMTTEEFNSGPFVTACGSGRKTFFFFSAGEGGRPTREVRM